ncbi:MAG: peptide-methionine (S)-S-oxide reductase MsrA [Pseudobutyrivibrio sp.]|nr:peptide-methionine (S)-S-oxide reductase MsrA [Pseudobutyrivibrio sp.]
MSLKNIYVAGGCFWGTERVFKALTGVEETTVGYANGHTDNPTYKEVCTDTTGHRETVKVTYDPQKISLEKILTAYFMVVDPTVKNQQGEDIGSQYQTGVYYDNEEDLPAVTAMFEKVEKDYDQFYVELLPLSNFWSAEEYHQDYLDKNPNGYCHITPIEMEKIHDLDKTMK